VVLGLAGRKVAATSSVELEVGDHLTLGTEGEQAGVTVLRVIQRSRGGEAPWRGLLRSLLATRVGDLNHKEAFDYPKYCLFSFICFFSPTRHIGR